MPWLTAYGILRRLPLQQFARYHGEPARVIRDTWCVITLGDQDDDPSRFAPPPERQPVVYRD